MSNQGSNSEISYSGTGGTDIRYKKALKQISKLVSMNTSLKKQLEQSQQSYRKLQNEYYNLMVKYQDLVDNMAANKSNAKSQQVGYSQQDNFIGKQEVVNKSNNKQKMQSYVIDQESYVKLEGDNQNLKSQLRKYEENQMKLNEQVKYLEQRILQFETTAHEKEQIIHQLELALEKKHVQIIQLEGRYGDLNEQILKQKSSIKQQQGNITLAISQQLMNERKRAQQLEVKLKNESDWAKKLSFDYEQLRKRMLFTQKSAQSANVGSVTSLRMPNIVRLNSTETEVPKKGYNGQGISLQKQKLIEQQFSKIKREYNEKKQKYKTQIQKLKQDNESLNQRINSMNTFIQKQQFYIQNYVNSQNR